MTSFLLPPKMPHTKTALHDATHGAEEARWVAAIALGRERGQERTKALDALYLLQEDPLEEIRAQALEGIIEQALGGVVVSEQRILKALQDPSAGVRCAAVDAVAVIFENPTSQVAPYTLDPDPSVRAAAARIIGELQGEGEADRVAILLDDPDEFVSRHAAMALAALGDPRGEPILFVMLLEKTDSACEAAFYLGLLGSTTALPLLTKTATRRLCSVELKSMAAAAMVRCSDPKGIDILTKLLKARREHSRMTALTTLARIPIRGIAPAVGLLIDRGEAIEASSAIQTLGVLSKTDPNAALIELESRVGTLDEELEDEIAETLSSLTGAG